MKSEVFNNGIGSPYSFDYPTLTKEEEKEILATLFEQLLIFDSITISTGNLNFALLFLLDKLGNNIVLRLIESGYIKFMIWSPILVTSGGLRLENGLIDESIVYGRPPITAGTLTKEDLDPEKNIYNAIQHFGWTKEKIRNFTKKATKNYVVPDGMAFANDSAKLIINAYENNNLKQLGLPFERDPNQLHIHERQLLLELGHKVLETAILSKYNYKGYQNEHFEICKQNINNIGNALKITDNVSEILKIENVPNLKLLYQNENLDFESVFKLRHLSSAKYFRKWINEVGENSNSYEITSEYINQIQGNTKFFQSTKGKFLKNLGLFGVTTGIGTIIGGQLGAIAGTAIGKLVEPAVDLGLGLLETFWFDDLLNGKNPRMFIDAIKKENSL
ncbi:hypothetical protein [Lacihabitans soyangensis]|uniref:Uncharacterized protein n=1 Tax=Lacihabitans soyangensis TaxID=869394 RepID=A0AAE3GZZ9_9BACT|nr:hypothetical protein [Lacihabitans soyangensis]MCP9761516.1 hypothetical protein [Lacihabitans soyangensis]